MFGTDTVLVFPLGPGIGALLFKWKGYMAPFLVGVTLMILSLIPLFILLPRNHNEDEETADHEEVKQKRITVATMLKVE